MFFFIALVLIDTGFTFNFIFLFLCLFDEQLGKYSTTPPIVVCPSVLSTKLYLFISVCYLLNAFLPHWHTLSCSYTSRPEHKERTLSKSQ